MNDKIINDISSNYNITKKQVIAVLDLLQNDNTIPFIARYRKDATGGLDEEIIKKIGDLYNYQINLLNKKEDVIRLIAEKGLLTDEIKNNILSCEKLVEVEDIYRPFKEKKHTKALDAINNGLEGLAKIIMSFPTKGSIDEITSKFLKDKLDKEKCIEGAKYIIAEWISDNAYYRKWIRSYFYKNGIICSNLKKNAKDEKKVYEMYYDYSEAVKYIKPHRILAINRGEKEKILSIKIDINKDEIINFLESKIIKNKDSFATDIVKDAIKDSYKRLIEGPIEREIRSELTDKASDIAIKNFGDNLEVLLLTPPLKNKTILAFDPGFINGCKIAVIDEVGKYLDSIVIKPFIKNISETKLNEEEKKIVNLVNKYNIDIIAIGNGTASRESEKFCADLIKKYNLTCKYIIVSEAGASIYSASDVAKDEFPNLEVEKRSAISIGRRCQDPLAELVKIPPEGIGVGMYQHDISKTNLKNRLDFVVEKCVNSVGVNINTASTSLLKYVSGLTKTYIDKIIKYRDNNKIKSRLEVEKILSKKVYEQSIGFLRVVDGDNLLDSTSIHPESYDIVIKLLNKYKLNIKDIGSSKIINILNNIDINKLKDELNTDIYTLESIITALKKPNLDPRDEMPQPVLKSNILEIKDLKIGEKLQGVVRNVVDFGLFIDIGLHNDGLAHISKLSNSFLKHPSDLFSPGDIVDCYVDDINIDKEKVNLRLIEK